MPFVILPSGETRYYTSGGDEVVGYSGTDAYQPGDEGVNQSQGFESAPLPWSGSGTLPWGATPTGRAIRAGGTGATGNDKGLGGANPSTGDHGQAVYHAAGGGMRLPGGPQTDISA